LEAAPMHGACGAFGVFWVGLMAKKEYVAEVYSGAEKCAGVFYGGDGSLLGAQVVGVICIFLWVGGLLGLFFLALKKMNMLRTSPEEEQLGLDESKHGGSAYNMELVAPMPTEM
jgi:Amt family ammonium transporter